MTTKLTHEKMKQIFDAKIDELQQRFERFPFKDRDAYAVWLAGSRTRKKGSSPTMARP